MSHAKALPGYRGHALSAQCESMPSAHDAHLQRIAAAKGSGVPSQNLFNAIALYIAACAVLSLNATALMTDYTGKDIAGEYAT